MQGSLVSLSLLLVACAVSGAEVTCGTGDSHSCADEDPEISGLIQGKARISQNSKANPVDKKSSIGSQSAAAKKIQKNSPYDRERSFIEECASRARAELSAIEFGPEAFLLVKSAKDAQQASDLQSKLIGGMRDDGKKREEVLQLLRDYKTTAEHKLGCTGDDDYWTCYSQSDCEGIGFQWATNDWGSWCTLPCSTTDYWSCYTEAECLGVDQQWVADTNYGYEWCTTHCSKFDYWACYSEAECNTIGRVWYADDSYYYSFGGYCTYETVEACNHEYPELCVTKAECEGVGFTWAHNDAGDAVCGEVTTTTTWR